MPVYIYIFRFITKRFSTFVIQWKCIKYIYSIRYMCIILHTYTSYIFLYFEKNPYNIISTALLDSTRLTIISNLYSRIIDCRQMRSSFVISKSDLLLWPKIFFSWHFEQTDSITRVIYYFSKAYYISPWGIGWIPSLCTRIHLDFGFWVD